MLLLTVVCNHPFGLVVAEMCATLQISSGPQTHAAAVCMDSNRHDWLATLLQQALTHSTVRLSHSCTHRCTHLGQLEDVLLTINDLESAARQPRAHITSVQPAMLIKHFPSLFLILQVPLEDGGAPYTDLQLRHDNQHPMHMNDHKVPEQPADASKSVRPQYIVSGSYIVPYNA